MKLLGSTIFNDKDYAIEDVRGFHNPVDFGLPEGFYGGRVDKVAGTDEPCVFLLVEKHKVIDIMLVEESEELEVKPIEEVDEIEIVEEDIPFQDEIEIVEEDIPFQDEVEEVEEIDYYSYTNDELRSMLFELAIEAPKKATKDELVALFSKED